MLELLAKRCLGREQTPYLIKGPISIKDIFERERQIAQISVGDNIYLTAKTIKMVDAHLINEVKVSTELVWVKDVVADGSDFVLEIGGNRMLSTFDFQQQWIELLSTTHKSKEIKAEDCWPHITEQSSDPESFGNKMIFWEPPQIEDYRVKSPTLFHYSDPLFEIQQEIREKAYQQSISTYNTRVNNYYQVLAHACRIGKVVPFYLKEEQIIKLVEMTKDQSSHIIELKNMITGDIKQFDFTKDIEIAQAYVMHDHFVIHTNIGMITSRNMEELFDT